MKIYMNIEDNEWYAINVANTEENEPESRGEGFRIILGKDIKKSAPIHHWRFNTLRPALPEEIPKPEPTLLERIEAAYPDRKIIMLYWVDDYLYLNRNHQEFGHLHAQSMKGFDGFIYDWKDEANDLPFTKIFPPVRLGMHPIAVAYC